MTDTAEQQARDLLERMEIPDVQGYSAGELVELANLLAERDALADLLRTARADALEEAIKACLNASPHRVSIICANAIRALASDPPGGG